MSRYDRYEPAAVGVLSKMQDLVRAARREECTSQDLCDAFLLTGNDALAALLELNGLTLPEESRKELARPAVREDSAAAGKLKLAAEVRQILDAAEQLAGEGNAVTARHLLHAAWPACSGRFSSYLRKGSGAPDAAAVQLPPLAPAAAPQQQKATPLLDQIGRDLTSAERRFPVVGRDKEIASLADILLKFFKPNPIVLGEPGVGKTAVVEGLGQTIRAGQVPRPLRNCRIVSVSISEFVAGAENSMQVEDRTRKLVKELEENPHIILFLDEIHQLATLRPAAMLADLLKLSLGRGKIRCIGATTLANYYRYLQQDEAMLRTFQELRIHEPDPALAESMLAALRPAMERHHQITIPASSVALAVQLAKEYLPARRYPEKSTDILDRACTRALREERSVLEEEDIRATVSEQAGIAFVEDSPEFSARLISLEDALKADVMGQDAAARRVARVVRLCKRRLDLRPERPDGVFLFTGPTGVGKSEMARSLARALTGRDDRCIRLDMSEFSEAHTVARLVGSPAGYVGFGEETQLQSAMRRASSGVLLLDEFEKAHPSVHRIFLQVFDSGRLTMAAGEEISLSNITVVATANIMPFTARALGFDSPGAAAPAFVPEQLLEALRGHFPPEILNRFDEIVVFRGITREDAAVILREGILRKASAGLAARHGFRLLLTDRAVHYVLDRGYSAQFGVRNLQRAFEELVLRSIPDPAPTSGAVSFDVVEDALQAVTAP